MSDCPYCRQPGAERLLWKVRCPNAACPKYDSSMSVGSLARARRPMAGSRGRSGPMVGEAGSSSGKAFNWGYFFGGILIVIGLMALMGVFRIYIQNRGFMWGLALLYLGWKTIQGSSQGAKPENGGNTEVEVEEGETGLGDENGNSLDSRKTARILYRSDDGLTENIVLRRSITVIGEEVTAMDSETGQVQTFGADKVANLEDVRQIARDNGQNFG